MIDAFMALGANNPHNPLQQQVPENDRGGLNISIRPNANAAASNNNADNAAISLLAGQSVQQINEAFATMIDVAKRQLGQRLKRMYKFPASWDEAKVHERAYRNGFKTPQTLRQWATIEEQTLMCPCCENFVNTIEIPLSYHTYPAAKEGLTEQEKRIHAMINVTKKTDLHKKNMIKLESKDVFLIQPGDALFFCFVKLVLTLLIMRFFILDAYNLYTNSIGNYCIQPAQLQSQTVCTTPWVDRYATPNKSTPQGQPYFATLDYLNLVLTIVSIAFFIYGRIKLYILYNHLETWDVTQDDYSVLIEDVPIIPFLRNDARVKDVNKEYQTFIKKLVEKKIRAWLNSFYAYSEESGQYRNHIDKQFFNNVYKQKREHQAEAQLYDNIVTSINLCYDLTQLEHIEERRQKLMNDFIQTDGKEPDHEYQLFDDELDTGLGAGRFNDGDGYVSFIPNQIDILNRHYINVCERISEGVDNAEIKNKIEDGLAVDKLKMSRFVGKAFVSLKYQHYKQYLLYRYQRDNKFLTTNANTVNLKISKATKPNDINWNNMKVSDQYRATQLRTSYLLVGIALVISGAILFWLNYLQTQFKTSGGKKLSIQKRLFLISLPLWTYLVNYTLNWGLYALNAYEKHKNKTEENSELIVKNVASKFFNTAVIYALVYAFGPKVNFLNTNGLVYVIISLVIINAGLNLALQFFQPYYIYLNWSNKEILQTAEKEGKVNRFQIQLNKMVEKPAYTYDNTYSYYLQMIYVICFYGYLVPAIVPITIAAFALQYWVDKYNLFKKFSSPVDLGYHLTKKMWMAFELSLVFRVIGHYVWSMYLHHHPTTLSHVMNYVCIFLSFLYVFVVFVFQAKSEEIIEGWASNDNIFKEPYETFRDSFSKTYQNSNPATAFVEKKADTESDMYARVTQYSLMEARKQFKKDKFVPENKQKLQKIWKNTYNETVLLVDQDSIMKAQKFTTILCL